VQRAQPKSPGYFGFIVRVSHGCFPDLGLRTDRKDELALMAIQLWQFAAFGSSEPLVARVWIDRRSTDNCLRFAKKASHNGDKIDLLSL